jgi:tRNA nucleotidyltransferase (CCA-adding enzyme)
MSKFPNDFDITTNALPEQIKDVFSDFKTIDVGIKHGTVVVAIQQFSIEITTYRIDGEYKDNRHPETVTFTSNLQADLSRRDFTINAIAYDGENIIDPFNGREDIQNHMIRCVGDPDKRFGEDGLRIMRALRFSSVIGFQIENVTKQFCFSLKENLKNISAERLRNELDKMLLGENILEVLLKYSGILSIIIPEIAPCVGFDQKTSFHLYTVWEHIARTVANSPKDLYVRLTMLFHDISKPSVYTSDENDVRHFWGHAEKSSIVAKNILTRLKYDNKTIRNVSLLVRYHDHNNKNINDPRVLKRLMQILGEENIFLLLNIKLADLSAKSEKAFYTKEKCELAFVQAKKILDFGEAYNISHLDITGKDLEMIGFSGKKIGDMLNFLLNAVIEDVLENKKEKLLIFAIKMLDKGF